MKFFVFTFLLGLLMFNSQFAVSQQLKENEIVVIRGEKFVLHQVRTGETIFSISRDFKVESEDLVKNNPQIREGLNIGEILKIPFRADVNLTDYPKIKKGDPTGFIKHTIESRNETPYFIAKKYGITVEEIFAYNPEISKIKKGMELRIPKWDFSSKPAAAAEPQLVAQPVSTVKTTDGKLTEHLVVSGETLYSLARKYNVPESEILFHNPEARNLKAGSKIYIPAQAEPAKTDYEIGNFEAEGFVKHTIASGETLWRLSQKYGVSEAELIAHNPVLKSAFPAGATIKIPVKIGQQGIQENPDIARSEIEEVKEDISSEIKMPVNFGLSKETLQIPYDCIPGNKRNYAQKTCQLALFLPLFLDANDNLNKAPVTYIDSLNTEGLLLAADTTIERDLPKEMMTKFYGNSENFLQFYEGVLLAVDSLQRAGMMVKLKVYDTQNNVNAVRRHLNEDRFLETDLILGPVYPEIQEEVSKVAAKNRIPMVLPFTTRSNLAAQNPWLFQINPSREYIAEKTAEMIDVDYEKANVIVLRTSNYEGTPEGDFVQMLREKFNGNNGGKFRIYDFKNEGRAGLKTILSADRENVIFMPSMVEGELSVAISNVNNLADEFPITLVGLTNYPQRFPSIELDHFHNLKFRYVYPFYTDYENQATLKFVEKFKQTFKTEPTNFGIQGFDAAFYFLNALNYYGNDFDECLPYFHVNLVQGAYHFEKISSTSGFMNRGVSVVSFQPDFTVQRAGIIGQPNLVSGN